MIAIQRALGAFLVGSTPCLAQQFVERPGILPGPVLWTEAVVPFDANRDGLLDLLFVHAQGFAKPGDFRAPSDAPLAPTLLIHAGVKDGVPRFEDRSSEFLPKDLLVHGKAAAVCDVDGDGHLDIVLAVAFGSRQRLLRKDPESGRFVDESSRLPELVLNSFHVGWGDLDDDGDLDLVFADAGPESFGEPGGKARLVLNDGTGHFTEEAERLGAVEKIGSQNAKLVDIDGDLDLDIVIDGKSPVTQVYFNDGRANFTLSLDTVPIAAWAAKKEEEEGGRRRRRGTTGAYEIEWADLDGDLDLDCFYMNWDERDGRPWLDAALESRLADTGKLRFQRGAETVAGNNFADENELAFLDADDDGDLDVLVSVLTAAPVPEKLFLNGGQFADGFLTPVEGAFGETVDATLDMAIADFDDDGRYDVVTAQGEIPGTDFTNRYYANTGPPDTKRPVVGRVRTLPRTIPRSELEAGTAVLRAWVQDAVVDDGQSLVHARLEWRATKGEETTEGAVAMPHIGGGLYRAALPARPALGARVEVLIEATDPAGNTGLSDPQTFVVCGTELYGAGDGIVIEPPTTPNGASLTFRVSGGPPNGRGYLVIGTQRARPGSAAGETLVGRQDATRTAITLDADGVGKVDVAVAEDLGAGNALFAQAAVRSPEGETFLSRGVEIVLCDGR